jgi:DNA-binding MarR family transcriptional regulator
MSKRTAVFAPLPLRAVSDARLSALELRVLAQIAYHDRLSGPRGQGRGCVASNVTLAEAVGCDYTRLSSAITSLVELGYIIRQQGQTDRRQRIYRVVHDGADSLPNGKVSGSASSLPDGKGSAGDSLPNGKSDPRDSLPKRASDHNQPIENADVPSVIYSVKLEEM